LSVAGALLPSLPSWKSSSSVAPRASTPLASADANARTKQQIEVEVETKAAAKKLLDLAKSEATLPSTVEKSIASGFVLDHGRVQQIDETGAILNDASLTKVQAEFGPGVAAALVEWIKLPDAVPGLNLVSVYLRGSVPRGLAIPGVSDVDTLGFATMSTHLPDSDVYNHNILALKDWKKDAPLRATRLRDACPACTGLEMKLVLVPADSDLGRWLNAGPVPAKELTAEQEDELGLYRIQSQGVKLYGEDIAARLPPATLQRPHVAPMLQADLAKAENLVQYCELDEEVDCASEALRVARWAGKRTLRAGMELAAPELGYYSRDLLPCHRAVEETMSMSAARQSLEVLQLTCMPDAEVMKRGVNNVIHELLDACWQLQKQYPSPERYETGDGPGLDA